MTKRSAETQLTKDTMSSGFNFSAGGGGGGPDDTMDPTKTADAATLAGRKFAPLRKSRGARGAAARSAASAGSPLPNLFANIPGGGFGGANTNGASSPSPTPSFGFGGPTTPPAQTFSNGSSSAFQFGQQQEQPKPNPFASIAPASSAPTNGTNGGMFGNTSSGSFGNSNAAPTNGVFGNSNAASTAAPSFGGFGATANNDKPASTGFAFGNSNAAATSSAPATGRMFGNNTSVSTPFTFGAAPTPTAPKEEPKPAAIGFSFGQPATASASEPPKTTPSFSFANPSFGAPAATTTSAGFGSGLPTDAADGKKPTGFTFGKSADANAAEPSTGSLFAKPSGAQPAQTTGGFTFDQQPKEKPSGASLFGKPAEPSKPMFGFEEKKDESAKPVSIFGGFGATNNTVKKDEPQVPSFGMPMEKKDLAPLFGPLASVEKKEEPTSLFKALPSTSGGFSFGAQKATEKPAQKLDFANPMFGPKPADIKPTAPLKPITFPASPFGPLPSTTKPPTTTTTPAAAPTPTPATSTANAVSSVRMRSPPLSSDSHKWSANQLTDYYNLFALRSLNHFFREELSKQDIFADLTPLCDAYTNEVRKIKGLMEKNQRYKFGDSSLGSGVPGKRAGEDNDERGGKRRAMGEEPKVTFTSPNKSSSSQALASVLGGFPSTKSMDESQKQTDKQSPKPASVFDNPSPQPIVSSWVNPFQKPDTSNLPDDPEPMYDDDEPVSSKPSGGLFDRISPPKDASSLEPKHTGGLFDRISPPKEEIKPFGTSMFGVGGDQTWTPDKGLKFSSAPSPSSSLFSGTSTNKGGLFGANGTSTGSSSLFGSKPSSATATPSALTSAENSEAENGTSNEGDPSDSQPPATTETDLSKQGPGEEDENSLFQARSIIYDMSGPKPTKEGVGTLRVLKNRLNGKSRIIVRSDIGKVVMNVALKGSVKYVLQEKRLLRVPEFLESGKIKTWGARIGKEEVAAKLLSTVEEAKGSS